MLAKLSLNREDNMLAEVEWRLGNGIVFVCLDSVIGRKDLPCLEHTGNRKVFSGLALSWVQSGGF